MSSWNSGNILFSNAETTGKGLSPSRGLVQELPGGPGGLGSLDAVLGLH